MRRLNAWIRALYREIPPCRSTECARGAHIFGRRVNLRWPGRRSAHGLPKPVVGKPELLRLEAVEKEMAAQAGVEEFKFSTNQDMLAAIQAVVQD